MRALLAGIWAARTARVLFAMWVGAMIGIAFIAARAVFGAVPEHLPTKDVAGDVIGPSFFQVDALGVVASLLLLAVTWARAGAACWRARMAASLLVVSAVDLLYLAPKITERAEPFGLYHGVSVGLWMYAIFAGLFLLGFGVVESDRR